MSAKQLHEKGILPETAISKLVGIINREKGWTRNQLVQSIIDDAIAECQEYEFKKYHEYAELHAKKFAKKITINGINPTEEFINELYQQFKENENA